MSKYGGHSKKEYDKVAQETLYTAVACMWAFVALLVFVALYV